MGRGRGEGRERGESAGRDREGEGRGKREERERGKREERGEREYREPSDRTSRDLINGDDEASGRGRGAAHATRIPSILLVPPLQPLCISLLLFLLITSMSCLTSFILFFFFSFLVFLEHTISELYFSICKYTCFHEWHTSLEGGTK